MYVTAKNIRRWGLDLTDITYVSEDVHNEIYSRCPVERGDILYIKDGVTTGIAAINTCSEPFSMLSSVALLKPIKEAIDSRFLKHWLNSPETLKTMTGNMTGSAIKRLVLKTIRKAEIELPPLNEQRRIADKLDTTLAAVEACKQKLNNAAETIQRFRQSVLAAAVSGELTREWREERGINEEWEEGTIGELIIGKPRNGYSPKACDYQTECKSLALTATTSGIFNPNCYKFIDEEIDHDSHLWLEDGDVLIQRANTLEYVGVSAIYKGKNHEFIYPDLMMKCKANAKTTTEFLHILLSSHAVRSFFKSNATGTSGNMPKINQKIVMRAPVTWPSREEQIEITKKVYELRSSEKDALAQIKTAEKTLEMLKRSLLNTAFRGELVPQDPNDEPASVLLQRIKAQREAEAGAKKPAKRGRKKKADPAQLDIPKGIADNHLAKVLEECGALSERALLAASELEPNAFELQLAKETREALIMRNTEDMYELTNTQTSKEEKAS